MTERSLARGNVRRSYTTSRTKKLEKWPEGEGVEREPLGKTRVWVRGGQCRCPRIPRAVSQIA